MGCCAASFAQALHDHPADSPPDASKLASGARAAHLSLVQGAKRKPRHGEAGFDPLGRAKKIAAIRIGEFWRRGLRAMVYRSDGPRSRSVLTLVRTGRMQ